MTIKETIHAGEFTTGDVFVATLVLIAIFLTTISLTAIIGVVFAQDRSPIKVKSSVVVSGVVIVDILKDKKPYWLQCNDGVSSCKVLKSGDYWMAELPPNYGMYDCKNVEVYSTANSDSDSDSLGQYCLVEK